ncbi:MAG: 50S ribosomal protein L9 [Peptococcaceae bacterium]|nr:50S ribosomal protein L9 [Peptococcaceae bacterium]
MKVILTADVPKVGKRGDVVDVKSGYAHNFLFKNDVAIEATKANLKKLAEQQAQEAEDRAYEKAQAEAIANTLNDQRIVIKGKEGAGGKLFGTITNKEVAEHIKAAYNIDLDKRKIVLEEKIKDLGTYNATIKLHPEVKAAIKVQVIAE